MAGQGSRVKDLSESLPKPLIEVDGQALYRHSLSFFSAHNLIDRVIPIIRREDQDEFAKHLAAKEIENLIVLDRETQGALETVSYACEKLDDDLPVVCLDSDLRFTCPDFLTFKDLANFHGALFTFASDLPRYSYVSSLDGFANAVAEKKVISNQAICGAYFISHGKIFKQYLKTILKHSQNHMQKGELYLSALYKKMLDDGKKIKVFACDEYVSMGTGQEILQARKSFADSEQSN